MKRLALVGLYNLLVLTHYVVFFTLLAAIPLSLILQPFYMGVVVTTVVIRIAFSRNDCPLSTFECFVARKIGKREKPLFMKHHLLPMVIKLKQLMSL